MSEAISSTTINRLSQALKHPDLWVESLAGTHAVHRLEDRFKRLVGFPNAVAVSNATCGLWGAFVALGMKDSEVITSPYTWGGSLAGLLLTGNRPVFADIDRNTLTLDPKSVEERITTKTKAILTIDIYGNPSDGEALRKIADDHGLVLIQDCAQSFGAYHGQHHSGWWSDIAVFSLSSGKALCAGEGGVVVMKRQDLFEKLIWTTQHPYRQRRDTPLLPLNEFSMNLRMNPLAAELADDVFDKALAKVGQWRTLCESVLDRLGEDNVPRHSLRHLSTVRPSFHSFVVEPVCSREKLRRVLKKKRLRFTVESPSVTKPTYLWEAFRFVSQMKGVKHLTSCPIAERISRRLVRLVPEDTT